MRIKRCIQIDEVREESLSRNLAGEFHQIVVWVARLRIYAGFKLEDLYREYGSFSIADAIICRFEQLTNDETPFCRGVRAVINRGKYYLIQNYYDCSQRNLLQSPASLDYLSCSSQLHPTSFERACALLP